MNSFYSPSLTKETLTNGKKISNLLYVMNPLREPSKRIRHFQLLFSKEDEDNSQVFYQTPRINKIPTYNKTIPKRKNLKIKKHKAFSNKFFKFYYQRPSDIFDKRGVIVSRHFKPLELNNKTFPENQIKYQSFSDKGINIKKKIYNNTLSNFKYRTFFDTEIKVPFENHSKNFNINGTKNIYLLKQDYNDKDNYSRKFGATTNNWGKANFYPNIKNKDNFLIENYKENKTENEDGY